MDKEGSIASGATAFMMLEHPSNGQNSGDGMLSLSVSTPSVTFPFSENLPPRVASTSPTECTRKMDKAKNFKELASELLLAAVEALDKEHQQQLANQANYILSAGGEAGPRPLYEGSDVVIYSEELEGAGSKSPARASRESLMIARVSQLESQDSHRPEMNPSKSSLGIFVLLPDWEEENQESADSFADIDAEKVARMQYRAGLKKLLDDRNAMPLSGRRGSSSYCRVASPATSLRLYWDIFAAVLLTFEALIAPMAVFNMPEDGVLFIVRLVMMVYWTVDIFASFLVGFYRDADGEIELRFKAVASRYLRTWFCFDILVVGLDWATYGAKLWLDTTWFRISWCCPNVKGRSHHPCHPSDSLGTIGQAPSDLGRIPRRYWT